LADLALLLAGAFVLDKYVILILRLGFHSIRRRSTVKVSANSRQTMRDTLHASW
jgi:hypothetical protein